MFYYSIFNMVLNKKLIFYNHGFGINGKNAENITAGIALNSASNNINETANKKQKLKNTIIVLIILFLYNRQTIKELYVFIHKSRIVNSVL